MGEAVRPPLMDNNSHGKNILDRIVEARRESIARRKRVLPDVALKIATRKIDPPRDFAAPLSRDGLNVIAELKKASPSRGVIRADYAPATQAPALESAGAAALSVLTEEDFFYGSLADLKAVIGVNNRDLRNFEVRLGTSLDLVDAIPENCIAVSESGLRTREDLLRLRNAGFDAFLIGEHLMKEGDPCLPLRELIGVVGADRMHHVRA